MPTLTPERIAELKELYEQVGDNWVFYRDLHDVLPELLAAAEENAALRDAIDSAHHWLDEITGQDGHWQGESVAESVRLHAERAAKRFAELRDCLAVYADHTSWLTQDGTTKLIWGRGRYGRHGYELAAKELEKGT